ncbi:MAG TPA: hypothetical protein VNG71_15295 [Pyrinomonadaceae bacterium]|nr:hypothetical protein [Pyrinomonadaceae bacterium]
MENDAKTTPLYQNLDTTFVNIWSLLRSLTERGFTGRVRVDLPDYSADVFMNGSGTPMVREIDRAAGTDVLEEGALHRLVLRARETPGTITVFEGAHEAQPSKAVAKESTADQAVSGYPGVPPASKRREAETESQQAGRLRTQDDATKEAVDVAEEENTIVAEDRRPAPQPSLQPDSFQIPGQSNVLTEDLYPTGSYNDWPSILAASGELIAAVERAVNAAGENFGNLFNRVRLQLADDYSFLDPMSRAFDYTNGVASLNVELAVNVYASGLSEALRRSVDRVAVGDRARRVRERVALEILAVARKQSQVLERSGFQSQLDRIAGTRVM